MALPEGGEAEGSKAPTLGASASEFPLGQPPGSPQPEGSRSVPPRNRRRRGSLFAQFLDDGTDVALGGVRPASPLISRRDSVVSDAGKAAPEEPPATQMVETIDIGRTFECVCASPSPPISPPPLKELSLNSYSTSDCKLRAQLDVMV